MITELPVEKLRWICDPQIMGCNTSEEMKTLETIIGQERAVRSLQFGLGIKELGFNIYVAGLPGTGRTTAVERFLEDVAREKTIPHDWCYVNNFRDSYRPQALRLPPGRAKELRADMKSLVEGARGELQRVFESTELYAILSGLSRLPIKQGIAVTGSVNQKGEVQAIGGVNEKIEGFFEVCKTKGLSGEQGVLIPESNVTNLMLKEEVVEAVKEGKFHGLPVLVA